MRTAAVDVPPLARAIVEAALWREGQGGSGVDELAACAIIALIDKPDGEVPSQPVVAFDERRHQRLEFWMTDGHTPPGERALIRVARRHGWSPWRLADLMFNCSSILLGSAEEPSRWRDEALERDARDDGWRTHAEGLRIWQELEPEVQAEIEKELELLFPNGAGAGMIRVENPYDVLLADAETSGLAIESQYGEPALSALRASVRIQGDAFRHGARAQLDVCLADLRSWAAAYAARGQSADSDRDAWTQVATEVAAFARDSAAEAE
jgi:hypothetical protein